MKKSIFILLAFIAISCSNGLKEKDIYGNYKVTMDIKGVDSSDDSNAMAMAMFSAADIKYSFKKGGNLSTNVTIGAMSNSEEMKWELRGDSIYFGKDGAYQMFLVEKAENGLILKSSGIDLKLEVLE